MPQGVVRAHMEPSLMECSTSQHLRPFQCLYQTITAGYIVLLTYIISSYKVLLTLENVVPKRNFFQINVQHMGQCLVCLSRFNDPGINLDTAKTLSIIIEFPSISSRMNVHTRLFDHLKRAQNFVDSSIVLTTNALDGNNNQSKLISAVTSSARVLGCYIIAGVSPEANMYHLLNVIKMNPFIPLHTKYT